MSRPVKGEKYLRTYFVGSQPLAKQFVCTICKVNGDIVTYRQSNGVTRCVNVRAFDNSIKRYGTYSHFQIMKNGDNIMAANNPKVGDYFVRVSQGDYWNHRSGTPHQRRVLVEVTAVTPYTVTYVERAADAATKTTTSFTAGRKRSVNLSTFVTRRSESFKSAWSNFYPADRAQWHEFFNRHPDYNMPDLAPSTPAASVSLTGDSAITVPAYALAPNIVRVNELTDENYGMAYRLNMAIEKAEREQRDRVTAIAEFLSQN